MVTGMSRVTVNGTFVGALIAATAVMALGTPTVQLAELLQFPLPADAQT
jgi:hypothetical protein